MNSRSYQILTQLLINVMLRQDGLWFSKILEHMQPQPAFLILSVIQHHRCLVYIPLPVS
jgi:hypothetical protein